MNKLSLPPRPNKQPTEAEIDAVINRGGAVAENATTDPETIRHVNVRLTDEILRRIDKLRSRRPRKMGSPKLGVSMRDWIVEAVLDKLEREEA